jgi:hypothetical protein
MNDEIFIKLFNTGLSHQEISKILQISKTQVGRAKKRLGLSRDNIAKKVADSIIIEHQNNLPELAISLGISKSSLYERAGRLGIKFDQRVAHRKTADKQRKHKLNLYHFDPLDEIGCYWLGFLYADGSVFQRTGATELSVGVRVQKGDKYHLENFLTDIGSDQLVTMVWSNSHKINGRTIKPGWYANIQINNYYLADILIRYGMKPDALYKRRLPQIKYYDQFMRGFLDGDGTVRKWKSNGKYYYLNIQYAITYQTLAQDICNLISKMFDINTRPYPSKSGIYYIKLNGSAAITIADWIWANPIRLLSRKHQKYKDALNSVLHKSEQQVSPL